MKRLPVLFFTAIMIAGCAHLPNISTLTGGAAAREIAACNALFPHGGTQFLHAIEIFAPGGSEQTVLGVVKLRSAPGSFHCALMTIEGLVLFEADYNGRIKIRRALPPFDKAGMAEGVIRDIALLFLAPQKPCLAVGVSKNAATVCRYPYPGGGWEDIVLKPGGDWEILRYSQNGRLERRIYPVKNGGRRPGAMASCVVLKAYGPAGYKLRMSLIKGDAH